MFDTLIRNGKVVDGTGAPGFEADVGVKDGRIVLVDAGAELAARETIDATGKIVCPGIIDAHSHADLTIFRDDHVSLLEPLVRQGITTFVGGNCGMALAPIGARHVEPVRDYVKVFTNLDSALDLPWHTMGEFLDALESNGVLLNVAMLAPHSLLRLNELGGENRYATPKERDAMGDALDQALDEGAIGLSTGLQYFPGSQSDTAELVALGRVLHKHGGIFASHLRSYSNTINRAIDEVIEVARENDIRAQISHIFWIPDYGVLGPAFRAVFRRLIALSSCWTLPLPLSGPLAKCLAQIARAREQGVQMGVDVMPTTTGFTHLLAFFPPWALQGTQAGVVGRLKDPRQRAAIRRSIEGGNLRWPHVEGDSWSLNIFKLMGYESVRIMSVVSQANKHYEGMSLVDVARQRGKHPLEAACDLLLEEDGQVLVFLSMGEPDDPLTERTLFAPLKDPGVAVSTDTILMGNGKPSHLFHGCYPKFIGRFVREMKLLPLETAVRKITALPAEHFQLDKRGRIAEGYHADLVVFDFDRIAARGSFLEPDKKPEGIEHVFINGAHVVDQGTFRPEPRPGGVLRGGG